MGFWVGLCIPRLLSGAPRPPFNDLIQRLVSLNEYKEAKQRFPVVVSVDIPSGWHVEEGDISDSSFKPDMLVCYRSNFLRPP